MNSLSNVIKSIQDKKPVILLDDISSSTCGYLFSSAAASDEQLISFFVNNGRGIILAPMHEEYAKNLGLSPLGDLSKEPYPLTIGVESRNNITTGISCSDRAETIKSLTRWDGHVKAIIAPGHIFPLIAKKGGTLVKSGVAEACLDILKLSSEHEIGILSHLLSIEGEFQSLEQISNLSKEHSLPIIKISDIIIHRLQKELLIKKVAKTKLPTEEFGEFTAHCYISKHNDAEHLVLTKNLETIPEEPVLVRMHSEKKLGDLFLSTEEQSREKLIDSLKKINEFGQGAVVYIRKPRKSLMSEQLSKPIDQGSQLNKQTNKDKINEQRELGIGAQMLLDLNIKKLKLLSYSKKPFPDLSPYNIEICEQLIL